MTADPRVRRSRSAILDAAEELLVEDGVRGLTVEGVAERSGVAKTTIYRHWPSRAQLVMAAVDAVAFEPPHVDTGDAVRDIETMLASLCDALADPARRCMVAGLAEAAAHDPELAALHRDFSSTRRELLAGVIARGVDRGRLAADTDVDLAVDMLAGPIMYRALVHTDPPDHAYVRRLVRRVLDPAQARA